ncbi:MAG: PorV/PorQ family protein, partial [bacterium]
MKKNYKILTSVMLILAAFSAVYSQGRTSLYIDAGAGARAHALGNAYVALADDPTAIFWNPAGIDFMQRKSVTFFYSGLPAESSYGFVGLVMPSVAFGSFGFGWLRFGTGGIEKRNDPTLISTFDFSEQLFLFSYGKHIKEDLSIGLTFKVENLNLDNSLTRFGTDFGLLYRPDLDNPLLRGFSFGLNVQNLLKTKAKLIDTEESSSRNLKLGLMKALYLGENRNALRFLADWNKTQGGSSSLHFGGEFSFRDKATIRLGVNDGLVAFGAGASYHKFRIDYNFGKLFDGAAFSGNHRFSIT